MADKKKQNKSKRKGKVVEKKGQPKAETPELLKLVKDSLEALPKKLEDFTDEQLLNLGKDKSLKQMRDMYRDAVQYCKFMAGEQITQESYDLIKKFVKESYNIEFYTVEVIQKDKKTKVDVTVEVPMCQNVTAVDTEILADTGKMRDETLEKYNKNTLKNQANLEDAQAKRALIQFQVKQAKSIAHHRQSDAIDAKYETLRAIWLEATGKKEHVPLHTEEIPEEKMILATF